MTKPHNPLGVRAIPLSMRVIKAVRLRYWCRGKIRINAKVWLYAEKREGFYGLQVDSFTFFYLGNPNAPNINAAGKLACRSVFPAARIVHNQKTYKYSSVERKCF